MTSTLKTMMLLVCLLLMQLGSRAIPPISVRNLSISHGLSNNTVRCIYQDKKGYMWFGTLDGLNRYDGYEFKVYRNQPFDTTSLVHNYISAICEDDKNRLWVGSGQGVSVLNTIRNEFEVARYLNGTTGKLAKIDNNVLGIRRDNDGGMLIATDGQGLLYKARASDHALQVPYPTSTGMRLEGSIRGVEIDGNQKVWLIIGNQGLYSFSRESGKMKLESAKFKNAYAIKADRMGHLWLATNSGLVKYDINRNVEERLLPCGIGASCAGLYNILQTDSKDHLWIGTEGDGIRLLDLRTDSIMALAQIFGPTKFSSDYINEIMEDRESRIWIGTKNGGVNILDPNRNDFGTIAHDPVDPYSLPLDFLNAFMEDAQHNLWVGTDGAGFGIRDAATGRFNRYQHVPGDANRLSHNSVSGFLEDGSGDVWIATFGGGVNRFNPIKKSFKRYSCLDSASGQENPYVWSIYRDRRGDVWASTYYNGSLFRLDRQADRFVPFDDKLKALNVIMEDSRGRFWVGNFQGLYLVDRDRRSSQLFSFNKPVRAIHEDGYGDLWLGLEGDGLVQFDPQKKQVIKKYTTADGLCNNSVLGVLEDGHRGLWLSTFNGLSRFDMRSGRFQNFYESDGLQSSQFNYGAALALSTGEMVFGGVKGFNLFNPERIRTRKYMPPLRIVNTAVNNHPVGPRDEYTVDGDGNLASITVPFSDASMSFQFAELDYTSPGKIKYSYFLENWDKGWSPASSSRSVIYNNIREGSYILHVRSMNADEDTAPVETKMWIIVLPPWYRTWWAYLMYLAIVVAVLYTYLRFRTRGERLRYQLQLAEMKIQHEQQMSERKFSFFTNISHEFRTLLTLIIHPIREMIHNPAYQEQPDEIRVVYRNSSRMLGLLDQLLLFRKADHGDIQLELAQYDIVELSREVFESFAYRAKSQKIDYRFECSAESLEAFVDADKFEIVLFNLISNAIKYTPEHGTVTMRLHDDEGSIHLSVSDTGKGMQAEIGDRIFDKYYQVNRGAGTSKPGFGIGLFLVKQFIELHHGTVGYSSEQGKGTTFRISIPKGHGHFKGQEIRQNIGLRRDWISGEMMGGVREEFMPERGDLPEDSLLVPVTVEDKVVLIADDHEEIRKYVKAVFGQGFRVLEASNGIDALNLIEGKRPDLVITDLYMPGLQGEELCRRVKESELLRHIPVILLTASSSPEMQIKCMNCGADDFISKPFDKALLLARVDSLLRNRRHLERYFYNEVTRQHEFGRISEKDKELLEKCMALVEEHLFDDQFVVGTLASEMGMSQSNLYKKITQISGHSPSSFVRFVRLRKAAEMLINTDCNINEAALNVGINDVKYFRMHFTRLFGMAPSAYVKKYRVPFRKTHVVVLKEQSDPTLNSEGKG